jgi:tetratricopeptide (TPR) repeat protein
VVSLKVRLPNTPWEGTCQHYRKLATEEQLPCATRPTLDPNDEAVIAKATVLRDQRSTDPALQVLNERNAQGLTADNPAGVHLLAQIAGLLIDIGSEGHNEQAIQDGLALLEKHHDQLGTLVTDASRHYNLGNAKSSLADLHNPNAFTTPGLADHDLLLAAKNHYWKALKTHDRNDHFAHQLRTNLANALRKSGRITEALTAYDDIIASNPNFTMAHLHRGLALLVLEQRSVSGTRTTSMLVQAATEYSHTADAPDSSAAVREVAITMRDRTTKRLKAHGYKTDHSTKDIAGTRHEATQHSAYRQFTLRHHLGLCERHSSTSTQNQHTHVAGRRVSPRCLAFQRVPRVCLGDAAPAALQSGWRIGAARGSGRRKHSWVFTSPTSATEHHTDGGGGS